MTFLSHVNQKISDLERNRFQSGFTSTLLVLFGKQTFLNLKAVENFVD